MNVMSAVIGMVVKWWPDRSYGFVKPDGAGGDYYLHADEMSSGRAHLGARVRFEVGRDKKNSGRIRAVNVEVIAS